MLLKPPAAFLQLSVKENLNLLKEHIRHTNRHTEPPKSAKLLFYINKKWRTVRDSNPRDGFPPTHFPGVRLRPLGQLSSRGCYQLNRMNCNPIVFVFNVSGFNYAVWIFDPDFSLCKWYFNSLFSKPFRNLMINFRLYRKHPINICKNCSYFKI